MFMLTFRNGQGATLVQNIRARIDGAKHSSLEMDEHDGNL
jgi:hypothetical protein